MTFLLIFIAIAAGTFNPAQSGANAELNKRLGHVLPATMMVYGSALLSLFLFQLIFRQPVLDHGRLLDIPWWAWLGGLISLAPTIAGLMLAQKMGSTIFTGVTVTAAVVSSIVFDHQHRQIAGWTARGVQPPKPINHRLCDILGLILFAALFRKLKKTFYAIQETTRPMAAAQMAMSVMRGNAAVPAIGRCRLEAGSGAERARELAASEAHKP